MATRRQPLIPGWLIPGLCAAALMITVSLAAFLALWLNAPPGAWSTIWRDSYLWHVVRFSFWQAFLSAVLSVVRRFFSPARFIDAVFLDVWRCCVCAP
ncbi:ABC transporter integral membrane protein [Salmonella enterica subsp. enterica serovar Thompson]|nr:ABC transporter integral membrane protein [Salmonella enterica subsp. enterica serovar Thompson]